ncbi:MAG: Sec-independent protein translocase protein TatB [Rhodocyclaceae bacterium]|nr:Sec-independent protein translocase protein TatB [Rhodocyclaceae bacterium]
MFDIGFSELMVIALVGLIVIGPEKLPRVARTVGHLLGRAQRYVADVKADIQREIQLEELKKMQAEIEAQAKSVEAQVNEQMRKVEADLNASILGAKNEAADPDAAHAPKPPPPPGAGGLPPAA